MEDLLVKLNSIAVFRALLSDEVVVALREFLQTQKKSDLALTVDKYSEFVSKLYNKNCTNLGDYLNSIIAFDENVYIKTVGKGEQVPSVIKNAVDRELDIFQQIADIDLTAFFKNTGFENALPQICKKTVDIKAEYYNRADNIGKYGYGIYASYHMFCIDEQNKIIPVLYPDTIRLSQLSGYEREKQIILENTNLLLENKMAANILLTGDAGTGKSSTIKAVVNELYKKGLRILQVRKDQLHIIPSILDELTANPLKFIIFIDDLSFQKDDDNYSALKAILEGSVSAKSQNVVIYATSNRRHLVRESFSDRDGDDVHYNDTVQEIISLSERFGIHITFNRPDKNSYLDIVHFILDDANVDYDKKQIDIEAEAFALQRGNRSARAARQFAESVISKSM